MKGETYEEFVEKFKPKKTTDDCYTPPNIYEAVAGWVAEEYNLNRESFVRPFYPGGDYENFDYCGKVVVDNPPFSIMAKIIRFYIRNSIRFFLFAPTLTLFSGASSECTAIPIGATITYENGAKVTTSFVTNLEPDNPRIRIIPDLYQRVKNANKRERASIQKESQKLYEYTPYLVRAGHVYSLAKYGIAITIPREESVKVDRLDAQKETGKKIFGKGYLVSERCKDIILKAEAEKKKVEAEKKKAETYIWELSDRETEIVKALSHSGKTTEGK